MDFNKYKLPGQTKYKFSREIDDKFDKMVDDFVGEFVGIWQGINDNELPELRPRYFFWQKWYRERKFRKYINIFFKAVEEEDVEREYPLLIGTMRKLMKKVYNFNERQIDFILSKQYLQITRDFLKKCKDDYPELSDEDIYQAVRNVWIMINIQHMLDSELSFTPSIFAYSMLYPYSDNYIDNESISMEEKERLNNKFGIMLAGRQVDIDNDYEKRLLEFIRMIEGEYRREEYPDVYNSLLAIHRAQVKSIFQQRGMLSGAGLEELSEEEILSISFEKGGTSVLADAYLINGNLSRDEARFFFGYGILLQLIDDLQDTMTDLEKGHLTAFSQHAAVEYLDRMTDRLFIFMDLLFKKLAIFNNEKGMIFRNIIRNGCYQLIFQSLSRNSEYFNDDYFRNIEKYAPVHFKFQADIEDRIRRELKNIDKDYLESLIYQEEYYQEKEFPERC